MEQLLSPYWSTSTCLARDSITRQKYHKAVLMSELHVITENLWIDANPSKKRMREPSRATAPRELINGRWDKRSIHFHSNSASASRWGDWNSHWGCTLTRSVFSCHRRREQEVGGCSRPKHQICQISQLKSIDWLMDVLRDFKSFTLTLVVISCKAHFDQKCSRCDSDSYDCPVDWK